MTDFATAVDTNALLELFQDELNNFETVGHPVRCNLSAPMTQLHCTLCTTEQTKRKILDTCISGQGTAKP